MLKHTFHILPFTNETNQNGYGTVTPIAVREASEAIEFSKKPLQIYGF